METNNETIEDIIKDILENDGYCISPTSLFAFDEDGGILLGDLAERIKVAHECETASKDEEILNLRKSLARVMEVTGDCRKCEECGDETCPWFGEPDGCNNREGRALFLAGKLVDPLKKKDAENAELRECLRLSSNSMEMVVQWLDKHPKWQECLKNDVARNRKVLEGVKDGK